MTALTQNYQCPDCGATIDSKPVECCDTCILKFYFDNPNASSLADWARPEGSYRFERVDWRFHDTPDTVGSGIIAIGYVPQRLKDNEGFDSGIFYYASDEADFQRLYDKNNGEDFYIVCYDHEWGVEKDTSFCLKCGENE